MLSNQILSANAKKREMRTQESQRTLMAPCEQLSHPGDSENPDTTTPTGDIRWRNSFSKNSTDTADRKPMILSIIILSSTAFIRWSFFYPLGIICFFKTCLVAACPRCEIAIRVPWAKCVGEKNYGGLDALGSGNGESSACPVFCQQKRLRNIRGGSFLWWGRVKQFVRGPQQLLGQPKIALTQGVKS
jgi:hypothetical protein